MMPKEKILFISIDYQSKLFSKINIKKYDILHVTQTKKEKKLIQSKNQTVVGCLEEFIKKHEKENLNVNNLNLKLYYPLISDRYLKRLTIESNNYLLNILNQFWSNIFHKNKFISVINEPVASVFTDLLLQYCKKYNVNYLSLRSWGYSNSFYVTNEIFCADKRYIENFEKHDEKAETLFTSLKIGKKPDYILKENYKDKIIERLKLFKFIAGSLYRRLVIRNKFILMTCFGDNLTMFLKQLWLYYYPKTFLKYNYTSLDDLKNIYQNYEIVFYPLNYTPESVLDYSASAYGDQYAFLRIISRSLHENQILCVKEHPQQNGALLQRKFLEIKSESNNIFFINGNVDSNEMIKLSSALVTLGSSAVFEALVQGKTVYHFGNDYFTDFRIVNKIIDPISFRNFLNPNALATPITPSDDEILFFLKKLCDYLYEGNIFDTSSETNISILSSSLENIISKTQK